MQLNLSFFSAASNAILKSGCLLKWKKQFVKDERLLLQLTKVMKFVRLTSLLPDVLCLSSTRPKLRHGRRLALLSHPNLTLNLCTLSFVLLLALLHLPLLLTSPTAPVPGCLDLVFVDYLGSHFSISQPKALCSSARGYLFELC